MANENEQVVLRYKEMWNTRNHNIADEIIAPDYVGHDPLTPTAGPAGVKTAVQQVLAAFPDLQFTRDETLSSGDRVVTRWTLSGTHRGEFKGVPPTGRAVTISGITVYRLVNGKIAESWSQWDTLGLMQQLGVVRNTKAA